MKGPYIKGIVSSVVGLALVVTMLLLPIGSGNSYAGAGSGEDTSVDSLDGFSELMQQFEDMPSASFGVRSLAAEETAPHTSATMHESTTVYSNADAGTSGQSFQRLTREMTAYFTEDAALYISDFQLRASSFVRSEKKQEDGTTKTETIEHDRFLSACMLLYIDADRVLMRFDRLQAMADGVVFAGAEKLVGAWAEFTSEDGDEYRSVYSAIKSVNLFNYDVLSLFGRTISEYEDHFQSNGDYYILDEEISEKLFGSISKGISTSADAESDGSFEVDLSDPTAPQIKFGMSASMTASDTSNGGYSSGSRSASASEEDQFTFTNIDNTVINMPSSLKTMPTKDFVDAMEEFDKVMEGRKDD